MLRPRNITRKRWGKLSVIDYEGIPLMLPRLGGGEYDSGEERDYIFTVECDCGNRFKITDSEFVGIRAVQSCTDCIAKEKELAESKEQAKLAKALIKVKPPKEPKPSKELKPMGRPKQPGTTVSVKLSLQQMTKLAHHTGEQNEIEIALKLAVEEYIQLKDLL